MAKTDERIVHWCIDSSGNETCHLNGKGLFSETLLGGISLTNVSGSFVWYGWIAGEERGDFPRRTNSHMSRLDVQRALGARTLNIDD